jgi:hypothetical protein
LWPFKVFNAPQYGYANEAEYLFGEGKLFIYVDSMCNGLRYGNPTLEFANHTIKEFVEIALGICDIQLRTTSNIGNIVGNGFQFYEMRRNRL